MRCALPLIVGALVGSLAYAAFADSQRQETPDQKRYLASVYQRVTTSLDKLLSRSKSYDDDGVEIAFTLDAQGNVGAQALQASSGDPTFDALALMAVRNAAPYPPLPNGSQSGLIWARNKAARSETACPSRCPVFLPGMGVGLVPPAGMAPSQTFAGFVKKEALIVLTEEPRPMSAIEKEKIDYSTTLYLEHKTTRPITIDGLQGMLIAGDSLKAPFREWALLVSGPARYSYVKARVPREGSDVSPADMEAALRSLAFRAFPSLAARVAALSFKIGDLGGMHATGAASRSVLELRGPSTNDPYDMPAKFLISAAVDHTDTTRSFVDRARVLLFGADTDLAEIGNPKTITYTTRDASYVDFEFDTGAVAYARFGDGVVIFARGSVRVSQPEASVAAFRNVFASLRPRQ